MNLNDYDYIIVAYSGGKDSTACLLYLLESGVDPGKIELWHHIVDGREGSTLMDWPVTEDYCRKFAAHFGIPLFYSWKIGGFEREMLRENQRTAPTMFEYRNGRNIIFQGQVGGVSGKLGTRLKFPQVSGDLRVRWCTAYLKIDVCTAAIRNQKRFNGKKTLVITGERAEESTARAGYQEFEPDRSDNRQGKTGRHVDHWRPVHRWPEEKVWEIMKKFQVNPHPAYRLGWGRLSCMTCIFGSANQFASVKKIDAGHMDRLIRYEEQFGFTMKRVVSLPELIESGTPYDTLDRGLVGMGLSREYTDSITISDWKLPAGAFGEKVGPY